MARRGTFGELPTLQRGKAGLAASWGETHWHASGARPFPLDQSVFDGDFSSLIREWILPGHAPERGMLSSDQSVITLGSCFARELRTFLDQAGFASSNFWIPSGLNNTFAILDFVSWCVTGQETGQGYRYDRDDENPGEIAEWAPEAERAEYLNGLREAGAFVFTLGLAEVWQDRETASVFWRGVPEHIFDADRHVSRLSTVEENERNVLRIVDLIREVNPQAPIVLTLSPVPLKATFRDISCLTADCVSKSVLRVAIDQVMSHRREGVYYWPSFEIVRWVGGHEAWRAFGHDDGKTRDVTRYLVAQIIDAFIESFYEPAAVARLRADRELSEPSPASVAGRLRPAARHTRRSIKSIRRRGLRLLG